MVRWCGGDTSTWQWQNTPLHLAAHSGHLAVVEVLAAKGANIGGDTDGCTVAGVWERAHSRRAGGAPAGNAGEMKWESGTRGCVEGRKNSVVGVAVARVRVYLHSYSYA